MCGNGQSESHCVHNTNKYNYLKSFQKKCLQYWPESLHETVTHGDMLNVIFSSATSFAEYEVRKFKVKSVRMKYQNDCILLAHFLIQLLESGKKSLKVTQFYYTAWPDHGVPENVMSLISFIRYVRKLCPTSLEHPLLVHCSAGIGRTGTFITLDMMMQQMKAEGTLSIHDCIRHLRTQRMHMVQTPVCTSLVL